MKRILFILSSTFILSINAQTTIFSDNFESYTDFAISGVGSWILTDVDLGATYGFNGVNYTNEYSPMSYIVFNSTATTPPLTTTATSDWSARSGSKALACIAESDNFLNNDWLISPQITLASSGNTLSFWYKAADGTYFAEKFKVGISTTGSTPGDFTIVSANPIVMTNAQKMVWQNYTYTIPAGYNGQTVRFAINCVSDDQFGFLVDDFLVSSTLGVDDISKSKSVSKIYPNPVKDSFQLELTSDYNQSTTKVTITDLQGRKVKEVKYTNSVNISDLTQGVYLINISDGVNSENQKIIKK